MSKLTSLQKVKERKSFKKKVILTVYISEFHKDILRSISSNTGLSMGFLTDSIFSYALPLFYHLQNKDDIISLLSEAQGIDDDNC